MKSTLSPPRMFAIISLFMIVAMLTVAGFTQTFFFRQTIIDFEAIIVRDMVNAQATEHGLSASDLEGYNNVAAQQRIEQSFNSLKSLSNFVHIKIFNRDHIIVWSDDPNFLGTKRTTHMEHLTLAMQGEVKAVFNPEIRESNVLDQGPAKPATVEFYVPLQHITENQSQDVIGVLSLYQSPDQLNKTIRHGLYLLWSVIGGSGLILFVALYKLFSMVNKRLENAEFQFSKLTTEHQSIVQIEKLSAMGGLVGEIAHQLNNPLVGVLNLTQLAEREVENPERVRELLAEVRRAGSECRDIVQRILRINQLSRSEPQATDIKELVRDTIKFCYLSLGRHHVVEFAAPDQDVMLNVDPVLIRHAIFNLIHNAILAAPEGTVTVSLAAEQHEGVPGYLLSVIDTGSGFSDEVAAKLFKPFFTTRSNGTGLGLSVAQHIAMKHGGLTWAVNLPAGGAKFSIWLPAITTL